MHSHVQHVAGNSGISYRRSHRRFLCTFQWEPPPSLGLLNISYCVACSKRIFQLPKSWVHLFISSGQLRKLNNLPKWSLKEIWKLITFAVELPELQLNVYSVYTHYSHIFKISWQPYEINVKHSDVAALIVIDIDHSNKRQWQLYHIGIRFLLNVISFGWPKSSSKFLSKAIFASW